MEFPTEEIQGFDSPLRHRQFAQLVAACVAAGTAVELEVDPAYMAGGVVGGRWFRDSGTGRIWRLVGPAEPFAGVWEQVYVA